MTSQITSSSWPKVTYLGGSQQESEIQANEKEDRYQTPGQSNEAKERTRALRPLDPPRFSEGASSKFKRALISQRGKLKLTKIFHLV